MPNTDDKYTDPELRTEIKEKIQESDKGGQPGQWSVRKAQMTASEYKKAMHARGEEPYTTDKSEQDSRQKHLSKWTEEDWQTSDGKAEAKQQDGTEARYLPKKAWEKMSEEEKREANEVKLAGSKKGKQYVTNTDAAKKARTNTKVEGDDSKGDASDAEIQEKVTDGDRRGEGHDQTDETPARPGKRGRGEEAEGALSTPSTSEDESEYSVKDDATPNSKRAKGIDGEKKSPPSKTKKSSTTGKSDAQIADDEHGQPASLNRLPEEGQKVHWRAASGWCEGVVLEILYSEKQVAGRTAKATKEDPLIVLKSTKSGKSAVHKPSAVHF